MATGMMMVRGVRDDGQDEQDRGATSMKMMARSGGTRQGRQSEAHTTTEEAVAVRMGEAVRRVLATG